MDQGRKLLGVELNGTSLPVNTLPSGLFETIASGEPYVTTDAPELLGHKVSPRLVRAAQRAAGIACIVDIPLLVKERLVGTMIILSTREEIPPEEMQLLSSVASQAAIAIENARLFEETKRLAATDSLTGLWNRRHIEDRFREESARAGRFGRPLSLIVLDIDKLKLFNDTYGHPGGDEVIRSVAQLLRDSCRETDIVGRHAGDEFAVILPETDVDGAVLAAERILAAVEERPFQASSGGAVPISVSVGIASYPADTKDVERLFPLADTAMYRAKLAGGGWSAPATDQLAEGRPRLVAAFDALQGLLITVDAKDHYTFRHSQEVTDIALALAEAEGLSEEDTSTLEVAARLHDVGKIGIPTEILKKPGSLAPEEWRIIHEHPRLGEMLLRPVEPKQAVLEAVLHHHEHYDGTGYPRGLRGEEIPLLSRLLAVADAFSAMVVDRPYRKALSINKAIEELRCQAGKQFDPDLSEKLAELVERGEYTPTLPTGPRPQAS
jgi:diguanylate cyclase (GGDEF)-like protein